MSIERTLSIIKPNATKKNLIGNIIDRFERNGLKIIAAQFMKLSYSEAEKFYFIHNNCPFFKSLVKFMSSGPIMVQVLEGENAIFKNRKLMGATDPKKADKGTIRYEFSDSIEANTIHGSDSIESAKIEIAFFFSEIDIYSNKN